MLSSNGAFASSPQSNSASRSLEDNIEVHAEDTCEGVILDAQINVLLDTEAKVSSIREVLLLELSVLDLEASLEDLVSLIAADGDMDCDFLVTLDTEATNGESGS